MNNTCYSDEYIAIKYILSPKTQRTNVDCNWCAKLKDICPAAKV